jgi:hypothetical protein
MLTSCKTKYVPVTTERVDSVYIVRTDTVLNTIISNTFDSIMQDRSILTTVDSAGNVLKETERIEVHHYHSDNSIINQLRARCDSLMQQQKQTIEIPYPVERELTWWENLKQEVGGVAIGMLIVAFCVAVVWLIKRYRSNKSA